MYDDNDNNNTIMIIAMAQKCHGNFNFTQGNFNLSRQFQFVPGQFQFTHGNFNFTHGNFNLFTAISICSRQFQFTHGNFNLLTAISICSRQFQFTHGNFNFLTANNAHGIFRFAHHLSTSDNFGGRQWPPKVKTQNQKSIFKVDLQREK